jgi:hypothetical protein
MGSNWPTNHCDRLIDSSGPRLWVCTPVRDTQLQNIRAGPWRGCVCVCVHRCGTCPMHFAYWCACITLGLPQCTLPIDVLASHWDFHNALCLESASQWDSHNAFCLVADVRASLWDLHNALCLESASQWDSHNAFCLVADVRASLWDLHNVLFLVAECITVGLGQGTLLSGRVHHSLTCIMHFAYRVYHSGTRTMHCGTCTMHFA